MRVTAELRERLRALLSWTREERAMEEELHFHLEMEREKNLAAGLTDEEAERHARLRFGGLQQQREAIREERGIGALEHLARDLRQGLRLLRKRPGFSACVVVTLAVGIGATSAVFSLIEGVLLTPPPYREPDRLALIASARADGLPHARGDDWSAAEWLDWQDRATSFDAIAAHRWAFDALVSNEGSMPIEGMWVTGNYFQVTGLEPAIGRTFRESDLQADAASVIVLGHELWQRAFGGDRSVLGRVVRLRNQPPSTIIGVMPPAVRFLPAPSAAQEPNYDVDAHVDYWVPISLARVSQRMGMDRSMWNVVGRLREGATLSQAQAELEVIQANRVAVRAGTAALTPRLQLLTAEMAREGRRILLPLLGAAALLLLIACANVAALMLIRGVERRHEYSVCKALGAPRRAIFRRVTVESLLLASLGGALGVALAVVIVTAVKAVGVRAVPRLDAVTIGWPVLAFGVVSAMFAAWSAGVIPAWRASRMDPVHALTSAGLRSTAAPGERRLLDGIVLLQMAVTMLLLVAAGLVIRTVSNVSQVTPGYDTRGILTMSVMTVNRDRPDFDTRALEQVSALPGVRAAAFAWGVPLTGNSWGREVLIEGVSATGVADDRFTLPLRAVTPGYFALLGTTVVEGRDFTAADARGAPPVAIVNEAFVERYHAGTQSLGKRLWFFNRENPAVRIIGVVANTRTDALTAVPVPEVYASWWQEAAESRHLVVRTDGDPLAFAGSVQRAVRGVDPTVAIENVKTLDDVRGESVASYRLAMQLLFGFALVATALTVGGMYSVLSLSVASRRQEIAIRSALGAEKSTLLWLVVRQGARLSIAGLTAGVVAAVAFSRGLESLLFAIEPTDPLTIVGASLTLALMLLLSSWIPARRASRVNPVEVLRGEAQ